MRVIRRQPVRLPSAIGPRPFPPIVGHNIVVQGGHILVDLHTVTMPHPLGPAVIQGSLAGP